MTAPASRVVAFSYLLYFFFYSSLSKNAEWECFAFLSFHCCCNWSRGHRGAVPAWKIKPARPPRLPLNKILSFAFPCCNLALLPFFLFLFLLYHLSVPHPCIFSDQVLVVLQGLERGRDKRGGEAEKTKAESSCWLRVVIWTTAEGGWGLLCTYVCISTYMPKGVFTLAAAAMAGASQRINLGLLNKYSPWGNWSFFHQVLQNCCSPSLFSPPANCVSNILSWNPNKQCHRASILHVWITYCSDI